MARLSRLQQAGAWYHLTARGNARRPIYRADSDRQHFLELLAHMCERFRCRLYAYVLMPNHYHLLLETLEANLSRALHWLNVSYTVWFNRRYQRSGHLLEGRFRAVIVEPKVWGLGLSRYIHLNPVRLQRLDLDKARRRQARQGLGEKPGLKVTEQRLNLLRNFRWSSYRSYAGYEKGPSWLDCQGVLSLGGRAGRDGRRRYRQYCEAAIAEGWVEKPWEAVVGRLVLGGREFIEQIMVRRRSQPKDADLAGKLKPRPKFADVIGVVEKLKGERWADFRDRRGDWGRDLALYLGREVSGLKLRELATAIKSRSLMGVSVAVRRFVLRLRRDKGLQRLAAKAKTKLANG